MGTRRHDDNAPRRIPPTVQRPPGYVIEVPTIGYFVKSRSEAGTWWFVWGNDCSCPASIENCWHVQQVFAFKKAMAPERPKHKPAPAGMFVD